MELVQCGIYFFMIIHQLTPEVNNVISNIPIVQPTSTTPVEAEGVDVKFVARDSFGNEVGYVNMKLSAADSALASNIKATSLLPDQVTGRAQKAIGAIYTFSSASGGQLSFSKPVSFEFNYVEPDDLTSKKENSLQIAEEIADGGWKYLPNTTLDIIANSLTVSWSELPQGRITILSNLEEDELVIPLPATTTEPVIDEFTYYTAYVNS